MNTSSHDLLFLLTLSAIPVACGGAIEDGSETGGNASSSSGSASHGTGDTASASGSTTADSGDASTIGDAGDSSTDTNDASSTSATSAGTTGGRIDCGEPLDVGRISKGCVAYVQLLDMCLGEEPLSPRCLAYEESVCQYQVNFDADMFGEACRTAYEEAHACLSMLSCRELDAGGCSREGVALIEACSPSDR